MFKSFKYLTSNQDKSRLIYHYNEVATQTTFSKQHCYDKKIKYDITQLQKSSALNRQKSRPLMRTLLRKQRLQTDCRAVALWVCVGVFPLSLLSQRRKRLRHHRGPHPHNGDCPRLSEVIIATAQILSSAKVWAVDK